MLPKCRCLRSKGGLFWCFNEGFTLRCKYLNDNHTYTLSEYSLSFCCFSVFSGMYFQFEEYKVGKFVRVVISPVPKLY